MPLRPLGVDRRARPDFEDGYTIRFPTRPTCLVLRSGLLQGPAWLCTADPMISPTLCRLKSPGSGSRSAEPGVGTADDVRATRWLAGQQSGVDVVAQRAG